MMITGARPGHGACKLPLDSALQNLRHLHTLGRLFALYCISGPPPGLCQTAYEVPGLRVELRFVTRLFMNIVSPCTRNALPPRNGTAARC
eukprot:6198461-Pleurochrysis_carterae.AAC.3